MVDYPFSSIKNLVLLIGREQVSRKKMETKRGFSLQNTEDKAKL